MKKTFLIATTLIFCSQIAFAQATSLIIQDTRNDITTPSSYSHAIESHFKYASTLGLSSIGSAYYTIIGLRGWTADNTGGKAHELAFADDSELFFRSGNSPSWEGWRQILVSDESGNVGVGTTDTKGYKLAINGNAIATSMTVKLYADWPDYAFAPTYKLATLKEVKTYIDQNHHLPEVLSAAEVNKNGINLGETNALLLKKIEELTLYLIEKDKQVSDQQKEIEQLKEEQKKTARQETRIAILEKALSKLTETSK